MGVKRPFGRPSPADRRAWIEIALGRRAPTRYLRGARVLHVFTGEWLEAGVALWHDRIAYVGPEEPARGPETVVDDLDGAYLVPGYVEVHGHPFALYSPAALGPAVVARGTTTLVCDTLLFLHLLGPRTPEALDLPLGAPARLLWGLRTAPQTVLPPPGGTLVGFGMSEAELAGLLDHPRVVQVFEWTEWFGPVRRGEPLPPAIETALERGLRIDAHAPGASHRSLAALAAAGATDCHESIRPEEVLERLRLGLYVPLRHSSLLPTLPALLAAVRATDGFERLMLTADGPSPAFLREGMMDQLIRVAIQHGVRPADAVRMATLHPASYLGLEEDLGAIAPGRLADLLVLEDPSEPTPVRVYVGGRPVAEGGRLRVPPPPAPWERLGLIPRPWEPPADPDLFTLRPEDVGAAPDATGTVTVPVMELVNPVITVRGEARLPVRDGRVEFQADPSLCLVVLLPGALPLPWAATGEPGYRPVAAAPSALGTSDAPAAGGPRRPAGTSWVVKGLLRGFGAVAGLATTFTCACAPMVLGRDPAAMRAALARIAGVGGGTSLWDADGERFFLPLEVAGAMTDLPVGELAERCDRLARLLGERGHPFHDPVYTLMFLSANHLPTLRLTPVGLWDVRRGEPVYGPVGVAGSAGV